MNIIIFYKVFELPQNTSYLNIKYG